MIIVKLFGRAEPIFHVLSEADQFLFLQDTRAHNVVLLLFRITNPSHYRLTFLDNYSLARLSKAKSTTHDFAQAIKKKLLKQKINYPIS